MPISNSKLVMNSPDFLSVRINNKLPKEITIHKETNVFKNSLKKFLTQKVYYSLDELLDDNMWQ